jgi:sulfur-oxidizing protein SoxY
VKAAGGCSAPVGADEAASLAEIGRMKLRLSGSVTSGKPVEATLMIRHPNFSGMQMDQVKRTYTPMRFVKTVDITYQDVPVLHIDGDISLATDPAIGFAFVPKEGQLPGKLKVVVRDSDDAVFEETFDIPPQGS